MIQGIPDERIRSELSDLEKLSEEKIEKLLQQFLADFKEGKLKYHGWTTTVPAYNISKAVLNAYTRILAKRYTMMCINCVHPGYVMTDINWNSGIITPEDGAKGPVMLALLPDGGPSGCYFHQTDMAEF